MAVAQKSATEVAFARNNFSFSDAEAVKAANEVIAKLGISVDDFITHYDCVGLTRCLDRISLLFSLQGRVLSGILFYYQHHSRHTLRLPSANAAQGLVPGHHRSPLAYSCRGLDPRAQREPCSPTSSSRLQSHTCSKAILGRVGYLCISSCMPCCSPSN